MSAADLEANRQGAKFYEELAAAHRTGKLFIFDIKKYVNEKWDENKNPNQYIPDVEVKGKANCKISGCR